MRAPPSDAPASEWLVYADALQQQGDLLGEFIMLVNAGDETKQNEWLIQHGSAFLGPELLGKVGANVKLDWRWGFIDRATVRATRAETLVDVVKLVLDNPRSERLQTLSVVAVPMAPGIIELDDLITNLASSSPPALELIDGRAEQVTLLTSRDFDPANNLVDFGALTPLWKSLRSLKLVTADVRQLTLGAINAPLLESFTLQGLRLAGQNFGDVEPCEACDMLGQATLPKLKHFELRLNEEWTVNHVDDTDSYITFDSFPEDEGDTGYSEGANWPNEFGSALRNLVKSPLETLTLTNFASTTSLLELLAQTGLPPTLRVLNLSQSSLSSTDVPWFTKNASLLSKLDQLIVRETGFSDDDVKTLKTLVKNVEHSRADPQLRYDGEESTNAPLPKYRYTVGME
ncbi:MAG: hypothetical protein QM817_31450 [Archangium sp.]